ncbi:MAG: SIMPL domain-containing protein [bacterium]|nr:SIMPL domain-containing protein [bacterium]
MHSGRFSGLALGLSLALGAIVSAVVVSEAVKWTKRSNNVLQVKGYAERTVTADFARWEITIKSGQQITRVAAAARLKQNIQHTLAFLKAAGFQDTQIEVGIVREEAFYKKIREGNYWGNSNEIEAYQLTTGVAVSSKDVHKVRESAIGIAVLLEQGADLNIGYIQYHFTGFSNIKADLLAEATKDAYGRAQSLAANSGSKVGFLQSARQGVFQLTSEHSTDVSDYGYLDTSSIEKKARAVVTAAFQLAS